MTRANTGVLLRAYLAASRVIPLFAKPLLKRRLKNGKENPQRWQEKCGAASASRPKGTLIWLHAVGLGETLALRGLIAEFAAQDPSLSFLITSTTSKSADAIAAQLPPRTQHQFLPLDAPTYVSAFLDHWQPDLAIWTEQDLWPGFVVAITDRNIPQVIVAGRMNAKAAKSRSKAQSLFQNLYQRMSIIAVQDTATQAHISALGGQNVVVRGSLKPAAPKLTCNLTELATLKTALGNRLVWIVASSHPADEIIARAAHENLLKTCPTALLIIAPRFPDRAFPDRDHIIRRTQQAAPAAGHNIWLIDTLGEMGLFYRLSNAAYIGGTNDDTEGHNPWEAIALGISVFHGPRIGHFTADFAALADNNLAQLMTDPALLAETLVALPKIGSIDPTTAMRDAKANITALTQDLRHLIGSPNG